MADRRINVGDLVSFIDHDAGAGFAVSPELTGLVVSIASTRTRPQELIILCHAGNFHYQYEDELEVIGEG